MILEAFIKSNINQCDIYDVNLKANNLPALRSQINEALLHKDVKIKFKDKVHDVTVIGINMFATPEDFEHKNVGLLVKYKP